jgi:hypothetical protein
MHVHSWTNRDTETGSGYTDIATPTKQAPPLSCHPPYHNQRRKAGVGPDNVRPHTRNTEGDKPRELGVRDAPPPPPHGATHVRVLEGPRAY